MDLPAYTATYTRLRFHDRHRNKTSRNHKAYPADPADFHYPAEIRKVIYTTNAIESVNMSLRKVTKSRGSFPNDDALVKLYYLALRNISKKWTMPIQNWKAALNRFTILFGERMPQH